MSAAPYTPGTEPHWIVSEADSGKVLQDLTGPEAQAAMKEWMDTHNNISYMEMECIKGGIDSAQRDGKKVRIEWRSC